MGNNQITVENKGTVILEKERRSLTVDQIEWNHIKHLLSNVSLPSKKISIAYSSCLTLGLSSITTALGGAEFWDINVTSYLWIVGVLFSVFGTTLYFMSRKDEGNFIQNKKEVEHYMTEVIEQRLDLDSISTSSTPYPDWIAISDNKKLITNVAEQVNNITFTIKSRSSYWRGGFAIMSLDGTKELLNVHLGRDADGKILIRILENGIDKLPNRTPVITVSNKEVIAITLLRNENKFDVLVDQVKQYTSPITSGQLYLKAWGDRHEFEVRFTDIFITQ